MSNTFLGDVTINSNLYINGTVVCSEQATFCNELIAYGNSYMYSDFYVNGTSILSDMDVGGVATFCNSVYMNNDVFMTEIGTFIDGCNLYYYLSKLRGIGASNSFDNSNICAMSNYIIETANVTLQDSVYVESNLVVGGSLIVQGSCCLQNVELTDIVVTNLNVSGLDIVGPAIMEDSALIKGNLTVNGTSTLSNDIGVYGSSYFYGPITTNNDLTTNCNIIDNGTLFVSGQTTLSNTILFGELLVNNDTFLNGNVIVGGVGTFSNNMQVVGTFKSSNIITTGNITIAGRSTFLSNISVTGSITSSSVLTQEITVSGPSAMIGDMAVSSNLIIQGAATFASNVQISATLTASNIFCEELNVSGSSTLTGSTVMQSNLGVMNDFVVYGNSTLCNNLTIGGAILTTSTLTTGNIAVLGDATLHGTLSSSNILTQGMIVTGMAEFDGPVNLQNILVSYSNVVIQEDLFVYGDTSLCNVTVTSIYSLCNNTQTLTVSGMSEFTGNATFNNTLYFNSNLNVQGKTFFNNTTTFSNECIIDDKLQFSCSNDDWFVFAQSNGPLGADLIFESTNKTRVTFTDEFEPGTFNFTGCHRCTYNNEIIDDTEIRHSLLGKIVVSTGTYNNLDNDTHITMDEAVPVVELAQSDNDKRVFGVIAGFEEHTSFNRYFKIGNIRFNKNKNSQDTKIIVNSIGEGAIKVCNQNGNFENGDLITSGLGGFGKKQDDDFVRNYSIAKITTNVNWADPDLIKQFKCGTEVVNGEVVQWALAGCIYLC